MGAMKKMMKAHSGGKKKITKSQLCQELADAAGVKKKQATICMEILTDVGAKEVKKNGKFVVPGLVMVKTRYKPATKACVRVMFGEEKKVAAMKARTVVKAFVAKSFKDDFGH